MKFNYAKNFAKSVQLPVHESFFELPGFPTIPRLDALNNY